MALAPGASASADNGDTHIDAPQLQLFVMGLFFIFGGITSLNDVIIPKLKELFTLNYTQAMLVQFCFFAAYAVIGIPGARLIKKIGYMRGAVAGLLTMMAGCLLFIPASQTAEYSTGRAEKGDWNWSKDKNLPKECTGSLVTCIRPGQVEKNSEQKEQ